RAALQVAASFNADRIANGLVAVLGASGLAQLAARLRQAQPYAIEVLCELDLPQLPSRSDIARRARLMLARSPWIEEIAARAHGLVLEAISARLATLAAQTGCADSPA
ncbi:MAG: hypothetical protein JO288_10755, partial [Hyphomicrobiales bacterium]|nr:hypothetical protein [Hyphomicrobiales bacterium]